MGIRLVSRDPFGGEPIIFDTLLFVREACQIRRLEVSRPCLAERGLRVETHRFVFGWGLCDSRAPGGRIASFLGGFQSENDDVASEKSGPAEGVGVWGRSPHVEPMSTTFFNIDMHVDIHLNIDC